MIEEMDPNEKSGRRNKDQNPQSNTPVLDNFSRDLIKLAEKGKLDPVIGRDQEIARIAQILSRRKKNNPIIIGEPGCGKTFDEVLEFSTRDRWYNSDEALQFGLIDEVIGVDKNKSITNFLEGFDEYYKKEVLNVK